MAGVLRKCGTKTRLIACTTQLLGNSKNTTTAAAFYSTEGKKPQHSAKFVKSVPDKDIRKTVFISQSYDVYTNLALEDWIYKNFDFTYHHILMLWSNNPCVVIGRHQNPFTETNVSTLAANGIELARRNSGGGAVYHDRGNLNCTFFTPRERYSRQYNLSLITRALYREYAVNADISDRDDITILGKKISGTAAKLGQPNAYHHCTLLVNSNKANLSTALVKDEAEIVGKATPSVRSPIKNLIDVNKNITMSQLLSAIGYEFLRTPATELVDGGRELLEKQSGFQLINPTEKWFPGLNELKDQYSSWDWRFGKTPDFSVIKEVKLKSNIGQHDVKVTIDVEKGLISDVSLRIPNSDPIPVVTTMKGQPYSEDTFHGILEALKGASTQNVEHAMGL
jgi:lipoyltransferase 1